MIQKFGIAFFVVLNLTLIVSFQKAMAQNQNHPVSIIFDSDFGPDYDDVGALAILHAMANNGECKILATISSNKHYLTGPALSVINTYFHRPDLPIGIVKEAGLNIGAWQKWDSLIVAKYPHRIQSNKEAEDAIKLYRRILSAQPDKSVTIVTVGFLTNMANLLLSKADEFSSLDGKQLLHQKVKVLVSMAACFNNEMGVFKEFNVVKDSAASKETFDNWPTPVIFSGFEIGQQVHTGLPITKSSIKNSPVKDVFARCIPMSKEDTNGRMSWDETAVLVAVRGYKNYFETVKGKIIMNKNGSNGWDKTGNRDKYLVIKMPVPELENIINGLMMQAPKK